MVLVTASSRKQTRLPALACVTALLWTAAAGGSFAEEAPPETAPPQAALAVEPPPGHPVPPLTIREFPWTWEHWWEANRDRYLVALPQTAAEGQKLSPGEVTDLRARATSALLKACGDEEPEVRVYAALALGGMGAESALPALKALVSDEELQVRQAAVLAIGLIGSDEALRALKEIIESKGGWSGHYPHRPSGHARSREKSEPRLSAYVALGLASAYADVDRVRDANNRPVLGFWPEEVRKFSWAVASDPLDFHHDGLARNFARTLRQAATLPSLATLHHAMAEMESGGFGYGCSHNITYTLIAIGRNRSPADVAGFKAFLTNPVDRAVRTLDVNYPWPGKQQVQKASRRLLWLFLHRMSGSAAIALGEIGDPSADDALLNALHKEDDNRFFPLRDSVRAFSAISLGEIGSQRTVGPLLDFIADQPPSDRLRGFAILSLGLYARPRSSPQGPYTTSGARTALTGIEALLRNEKEPPVARSAAAMAAAISGDRAFIPLLRANLAAARNETLQGYLMLSLGMLGDQQAFEPIAGFLARTHGKKDGEVIHAQRLAVLGLASLRTGRAVPELQKVLNSSHYVDREVVHGLALMHAWSMAEPMIDHLGGSSDAHVRAIAAEALGLLLNRNELPPLSRLLARQNFMQRDEVIRPYQTLANEYLYEEMIRPGRSRWYGPETWWGQEFADSW